jgi:MraZ protein
MRRLMIGFASELELDGQGRILLTNEQREFAGLGKRVALVGQVQKFEIWDEAVWSENQEQWQAEVMSEDGTLSEALQGITL